MKNQELKEIEQPKNLEDCFRILKNDITDGNELVMFKDYLEVNAVAITHHTLGRFLRNNWYLWWTEETAKEYKNYPKNKPEIVKFFNEELGIKHPDHISALIIGSFHRVLNGIDLDIDNQAKKYREFEKNNLSN